MKVVLLRKSDYRHNFKCECGFCQRLNRFQECVCCLDNDCSALVAKNEETIEPEGFRLFVHNTTPGIPSRLHERWLLQTAWCQCKRQYRDSCEGPAHKPSCSLKEAGEVVSSGILGKVRVVLPSCAVCCIGLTSLPQAMKMTLCWRDFAL